MGYINLPSSGCTQVDHTKVPFAEHILQMSALNLLQKRMGYAKLLTLKPDAVCHDFDLRGRFMTPINTFPPFPLSTLPYCLLKIPLLTLRESLVTSKDGKRNHISVIQPVENMRWDLMNMMSVQLASET